MSTRGIDELFVLLSSCSFERELSLCCGNLLTTYKNCKLHFFFSRQKSSALRRLRIAVRWMASRAVAPKDFSKETEYFDVAPSVYLDNIINAVYDYTADVLDAVEGVLKEQEDLKGREKDIEKVRSFLRRGKFFA